MVSQLVSSIAVVTSVALAALVIAGIGYAARGERRPAALWIGGGAVAAWCGLAFVLARLGVFETDPDTTFAAIAPAIAIPVIAGFALLASERARAVIDRVPLHWLVGAQFYRVVGAIFLIAYLQDDVPGAFALPAGIGDVLVGIAAPFVAIALARRGADRARPLVTAWCAMGIADLVVAVSCGFLSAPSSFQQLALSQPNAAITSYPLVLIPAFAVPLSIVLHVCVLARLRPRREGAARARIA
jgi:hypothetical protein